MADSSIPVTSGSGNNVDTRTMTGGDHRQVIVVGDPSDNAAVAAVVSADPGASSAAYGSVVRLAGSASVQVVGSTGTMGVHITGTSGTIQIKTDPSSILSGITSSLAVYFDRGNPSVSISNAPSLTGITNSIGVHIVGTSGTIQVKTDPSSILSGITSSLAVYFDRGNPSVSISNTPSLTGITNSIGVHIVGTSGTIQVKLDPDSTLGGIRSSINVYLGSTAGTIGVRVGQIDGTAAVFFSPAAPAVRDISSTAVLPVTASSTYNGVSVSGGTLISPVVGSVVKVFSFSLTTTAQVSLSAKFTNGAGTSPTEFWRVALQAPSQGIAGANLAVTPPGYIWATASGSTLSLVLDSASLVHYSVGYFRESA